MSGKLNAFFKLHTSPSPAYAMVFIVVFLLVFTTAVAITFGFPEGYASTASIEVSRYMQPPATSGVIGGQVDNFFDDRPILLAAFKTISSPSILSNVVEGLNLNQQWGKKYNGGRELRTAESIKMLSHHLKLHTISNTRLIRLTVYSEDKYAAAQIANAIAKTYIAYRTNSSRERNADALRTLEMESKTDRDRMEKLQEDKEALARRFAIVENARIPNAKYLNQMIEGESQFETLKVRLSCLHKAEYEVGDPTYAYTSITKDATVSNLMAEMSAGSPCPTSLTTAKLDELNNKLNARLRQVKADWENELASQQAALEVLQAAATPVAGTKSTLENQPYWDKKCQLDDLLEAHKLIEAEIAAEKMEQTDPLTLAKFNEPAEVSNVLVKTNKPLDIFIGVFGGVLAGSIARSFAKFLAGLPEKRKAASGTV